MVEELARAGSGVHTFGATTLMPDSADIKPVRPAPGRRRWARCVDAGLLTATLACIVNVVGFAQHPAVAGNLETSGDRALPNPRLADLADGEALDLGPYDCESRVPRIRCETIFDYSRINYDPYNHRILAFGGGHAATGRTDVDVFDLRTLKWQSLYPSMTCDEVAEQDLDPRGFHRKTGHPMARHTYDQNVIAEVDGTGWLLMFSTEGFSGFCHKYNAPIHAVAGLRLDAEPARWSYSPELSMPWGYAGSAEFDPVSGMVILIGGRSRGMWVYDPSERRIVVSVRRFDRAKNSSNLIYDPRGDRMYLIDRETLDVRMYELDREDWKGTTETVIRGGGNRPPAFRNLAYDSRNHVIGGIQDGAFHAFDLAAHVWSSYPVRERSPDGYNMGIVRHHAIDYDPVNNVFVFVSGRRGALRTWAYRFRN